MAYSSIKRKSCKQEGCSKMPQLGLAGWCFTHCPEEIKAKYKSKKDLQIKTANARKYASTKLRMQNYKDNSELKNWFKFHMINSKMECENCGADLSHYNDNDWKGSQDHIIEKSIKNGCPSVATVLENHCVLGKWCCHSQKHTSDMNLSKMKIFPELKRRFELFKDKIAEDEKNKIPECFLIEILPTEILPLIPNLEFKLLHESLLKGEVEMYEEITKKYSLESYQKSIVEGLYKQNKINK